MLGSFYRLWYNDCTDAVVAQLAEQLIRNEQVAGSIPVNGSIGKSVRTFSDTDI